MVAGIWVHLAYPTGEHREDAQGRRQAVTRKAQRVVWRALGLWDEGHWESVHWPIATGATEASWPHFLAALDHKGITEETTKRGVNDGRKGLESTLDDHGDGGPHQRGIFHKLKHLTDHLVCNDLEVTAVSEDDTAARQARQARREAILADASQVYEPHWEAALREWAALFRATWQAREPKAVAAFCVDFAKTFSYLSIALPNSLLSLVRTPNRLEWCHREARRKQHAMGMCHSERGGEVLWYLRVRRETATQPALVKCRRCRL
jgi:hypothetical protein